MCAQAYCRFSQPQCTNGLIISFRDSWIIHRLVRHCRQPTTGQCLPPHVAESPQKHAGEAKSKGRTTLLKSKKPSWSIPPLIRSMDIATTMEKQKMAMRKMTRDMQWVSREGGDNTNGASREEVLMTPMRRQETRSG